MADLELPSRSRLRSLSIAVLLVVSGVAIAGFFVTRGVVRDQERKLLKQRTDEAGLYLTSAIGGITGPLGSLAAVAAGEGGAGAFTSSANLATKVPNSFASIALISTKGTPHVVASGGQPISTVGAARAAAVQQAVAAEQGVPALAATPLFDSGSAKVIGFAYATPALPDAAIYAESVVHPEVASPATSGQAFSELVATVYAGSRVDPGQLIVSSAPIADLPLRGDTATTLSAVGQGKWLLVAKARHSLVGSVATLTPWFILAGGLIAALLATVIVETLARRREYALSLVQVRTEELQDSLSELAAAHEQLVRQERLAAIGQLASTIGHELRNPLGVISNAVYLLRNDFGPVPTEAAQRHLATAEREISAATVIVSDLLEFARQREPVVIDVDLKGLIEEVLAVLPPPRGVTARAEVAADVTVPADRDMLRQVLLNLVGNGYQAMLDGGELTVRASADASGVRIAVVDSGSGMDEDTRSRLFEPFFTTKARGVGLGLAVSKRIIEAHNGEIEVQSAVAHGTTFTIVLHTAATPRIAAQRTPDPSETAVEADA